MSTIEKSIDVHVPVHVAYNQSTMREFRTPPGRSTWRNRKNSLR